jgi:CMP-N,N'-diacetyllegionaminic acid synthase
MKTVGVITARRDSKGLPDKNKLIFAGKPLIEWTMEAALKSRMLDSIIISTDDWDIIDIAKRCGIPVPFVRPEGLARDDTPHIDVVLHALREVGGRNFTHCCLLQPTSPLRTSDDIDEACVAAARNPRYNVLSVTENREYPFIVPLRMFGKMESPPRRYLMRQKIKTRYCINGAIFVNTINSLISKRSFYGGNLLPYIMPKERSLQIDDRFDFTIAEYAMFMRQERNFR